jgi:hypothetical protein
MSAYVISPTITTLVDGVNDAVTVPRAAGLSAVFWITAATGLSGLILKPELSYDGTTWFDGVMMTTNNPNVNGSILVSATLAAVPTYAWHVPAQGARLIRLRCTAIAGGSATVKGYAALDPSAPR